MKRKKIIILSVILFIISIPLIAVTIFCVDIMYSVYQEKKLRHEIENIAYQDIYGEFNEELICRGQYGEVERSLKDLEMDYRELYKNIDEKDYGNRIGELLSTDNLAQDSPYFVTTEETIESLRMEQSEAYSEMDEFLDRDNIMSYRPEGVDGYYKEIFEELAFSSYGLDLETAKDSNEEILAYLNETLDGVEAVIDFLSENNGKRNIVENDIIFSDEELAEQYLDIIRGIFSQ